MFRDLSITSLTGASQTAIGQNGNRQFLLVENTGSANIGVNFSGPATGGTQTTTGIGNIAAIGGTGTVTLVPGGSILLDHVVAQNPVNVIGTSGQTVAIIEA